MFGYVWRATHGYRLRPWRSPYLLWRIETYWGTPADKTRFTEFWVFLWHRRGDLLRFLYWTDRMR